jgi:hypothetical protein
MHINRESGGVEKKRAPSLALRVSERVKERERVGAKKFALASLILSAVILSVR